MTRLAPLAFALLAALGLSASGPFTGALSSKNFGRIKTVAIISAVGQSFAFEEVRAGAFEWFAPPDTRYLEISDWKIDDTVTKEIEAALAARFTVKQVYFQRADFGTWNYASLKQRIFQLNGDPDIDAYIAVLRDWHDDEIGNSVHDLQGLGFYRRDARAGATRQELFAAYRIVVIDANTGAIFASRVAAMPDGGLPRMPVAASLWPTTPNDLTEAQKKALQADLAELIDDTLRPTLEEMKLAK